MIGLGLLILRLVVGLTIAGHGAQKLFGWWGGPGMNGWTQVVTKLRIRPADVLAGPAAAHSLPAAADRDRRRDRAARRGHYHLGDAQPSAADRTQTAGDLTAHAADGLAAGRLSREASAERIQTTVPDGGGRWTSKPITVQEEVITSALGRQQAQSLKLGQIGTHLRIGKEDEQRLHRAAPIILDVREPHASLSCRLIRRQQLLSVNSDGGQPDEHGVGWHRWQVFLRAQSSRPR